MPERDELEAIGSEGSLFLDDPWHCTVPVIELRRDGKVERIELEPVDSYRLELENVSDAIRGEGELLLRPQDGPGAARTLSGRRGRSRRCTSRRRTARQSRCDRSGSPRAGGRNALGRRHRADA